MHQVNPEQYANLLIHSVKRLSDGEVFTVGDKIEGFGETPVITIEKFMVDPFNSSQISAYHINGYGKSISAWKKIKERKALFTTEDFKPLYEGDSFWFTLSDYTVGRGIARPENVWAVHIFSTEALAKEWTLLNKPCLSIKEIMDKLPNLYNTDNNILKDLVRQKINQ